MLQVGEKTNLEMDVYRQALSVVEEQLLPTGESTQYIAGRVVSHTHTKLCTRPRLFASCRMPKHAPIYHRDKCEFSWTVINPSPKQDRAHGSDIIIEYQLDSQQKCSLQGDWSLYCPLSCLWKSRDQRENMSLMDSLMK